MRIGICLYSFQITHGDYNTLDWLVPRMWDEHPILTAYRVSLSAYDLWDCDQVLQGKLERWLLLTILLLSSYFFTILKQYVKSLVIIFLEKVLKMMLKYKSLHMFYYVRREFGALSIHKTFGHEKHQFLRLNS